MHIAIDSRFYGLEHTGLGRYTVNLIHELAKLDKKNHYYLLLRQSVFDQFADNLFTPRSLGEGGPSNFHPLLAEARHYSLKEQLLLPRILRSIKPDLLHVPHFNIPVFWPGKLVVTIHDLIKHQSVGPQTSTLPPPLYWLKHQVYKQVFKSAIHRASAILVPSNFVKRQLVTRYQVPGTRIHVTPEAPDPIYYQSPSPHPRGSAQAPSPPRGLHTSPEVNRKNLQPILLKKYHLTQPYLIYTGNAYPHKNLKNLIRALSIIARKSRSTRRRSNPVRNNVKCLPAVALAKVGQMSNVKCSLAIVSSRNIFLNRLEHFIKAQGLQNSVHFLGFVPDPDLRELYRHSLTFITPSLHEGFGLPGLEAMAAGTPVLASRASCLPEIYSDAAIYFDPHHPQDIADKILKVLNLKPSQRRSIISHGLKHSQQFSWTKLAKQTLEVYQDSAN